jgi:hypothetical protein
VTLPAPPEGRNAHPLHAGERIWRESNCYVDLWIGLLHHLELDPVAMLACCVAPHFEGDQWTFHKPSSTELALLYGVRVEELTVWQPLKEHVMRQLALGRFLLVEVDGYHLPDTRGVTYRVEHNKTTIGIHRYDATAKALGYFHNSGSYALAGEDLDGALSAAVTAANLPPFTELADPSRRFVLPLPTLRARSLQIAAQRLALAPARNPFAEWALVASEEVEALASNAICYFHAWAFAAVRQAGATTELLAFWCDWIRDDAELAPAAAALRELSQTLAAQQFRLARVPSGGRRPDFADALRRCAALWERAQRDITRVVSESVGGDGAPVAAGSEAALIMGLRARDVTRTP